MAARLVALGWLVLLATSFTWQLFAVQRNVTDLARTEGRSSYAKDVLYRRWATSHGGVYVPPTATTPPNPYLDVPDRDVTTTSGRRLTLINPAYMTREVQQLASREAGVRGHITSARPVRPDNAPDAWERAALADFERGVPEVSSVAEIGGRPYLRLMRPMVTERGCLRCHAKDGYREGDIRGGISVSVPLEPYRTIATAQIVGLGSSHGVMALLGLAGIWFGRRQLGTHLSTRRRITEELHDSEERYRRLVEMSPDAVFVHVEGRIVFANDAAARLLGVPRPEDLFGRPFLDFVHPDEGGPAAPGPNEPTSDADPTGFVQTRLLRGDGSAVSVEVGSSPLTYGRAAAVQVVARDLTERLRVEARLRQAQKVEGIGQLAGGIAHDFNNILTSMAMQLGVLRTSSRDGDLTAGLRELEAGVSRAASLTRQLLAFGRQSVMQIEAIDVGEVFENTLAMLKRLIGEHITLRFDRQPGLPSVDGDVAMLEQVLLNLVVNARDAMPDGGELSIRLTAVSFDGFQAGPVGDRRPGSFVCLEVGDTGCGMDEETARRVFEPFFTTKPQGRGTGLGLATVDGIVRQHHGWIEVDTAPRSGATFRVYLPVSAAPRPAADRGEAVQAARPGRAAETILVVEDDENVRRLATRVLRAAGYAVIEAGDGPDAEAAWRRAGGLVDLLFTDMVMPGGMTGLQLAERLRREAPGLKVMVTSGYSADIRHVGALAGSGVAFLGKPYHVQALTDAIRAHLDGSGTQVQAG